MTFLHRSGVAMMMRSNRVGSSRVGRQQVVVERRSIGGDICRRGGEVDCYRYGGREGQRARMCDSDLLRSEQSTDYIACSIC